MCIQLVGSISHFLTFFRQTSLSLISASSRNGNHVADFACICVRQTVLCTNCRKGTSVRAMYELYELSFITLCLRQSFQWSDRKIARYTCIVFRKMTHCHKLNSSIDNCLFSVIPCNQVPICNRPTWNR